MKRDPFLRRGSGRELSLTSNSTALIAANVVRLGLGFLYWVLAARLFPARDVGLAGAVVAAMMLCLLFGLLGIGSATIAAFPAHRRDPSPLLNTTFVLVATVAGASAVVYLAAASSASVAVREVLTTPSYAGLFLVACVTNTLAGQLDHISTAVRRADQAVVRGALFGASALMLMAVGHVLGGGDELLFAPWAVGGVAICVLGFVQLTGVQPRWRSRLRVDRAVARGIIRVALPNHALTLADRAPGLLLPMIVTAILSPATNATWYVVWMMAGAIYIIPVEVGVTMFSEVAQRPETLRRSVLRGIQVSLAFGVGGAACVAVLAPVLLTLMGKSYASGGIVPLRLLLLAVIPMAAIQAYFAVSRARNRLREATVSAWLGGTVAVVAAGFAGSVSGLVGMALAWLGVQVLLGMWASARLLMLVRSTGHRETREEPARLDTSYSSGGAVGALRASAAPIAVEELELSEPLPPLAATSTQALVLVRLHGHPVGLVVHELDGTTVTPAERAARTWEALGPRIRERLAADGLPVVTGLDEHGLPAAHEPRCLAQRRAHLDDPPRTTVVIPTRDRPLELLDAAAASVLASEFPRERFDLLILDNAPSTEDTRRWAEARGITYVREPAAGVSRARNRAFAEAQGEIVAFVDDDAVVDPQWLAEITRPFRDPRVACVTGLVTPLVLNTPAQVLFEQYRGPGTGFEHRVYDLDEHRPADPLFPYTAGRFGASNNCAFRRAAIETVGGFDPSLGGGTPAAAGEDLEMFFRIVASGHRLVVAPAAHARHLNRDTYEAFRAQMRSYGLGLGSYVTKLATDPRRLPGILRRVPRGLALLLAPGSPKNERRGADYPPEIRRLELAGLVQAPAVYLRSRRMVARQRRSAARPWTSDGIRNAPSVSARPSSTSSSASHRAAECPSTT